MQQIVTEITFTKKSSSSISGRSHRRAFMSLHLEINVLFNGSAGWLSLKEKVADIYGWPELDLLTKSQTINSMFFHYWKESLHLSFLFVLNRSPFLASTIDLSTSTVDTDFIASRSMKRRRRRHWRRRRRRRQKNCFNFAMAAFQLSGLRYLEPVWFWVCS